MQVIHGINENLFSAMSLLKKLMDIPSWAAKYLNNMLSGFSADSLIRKEIDFNSVYSMLSTVTNDDIISTKKLLGGGIDSIWELNSGVHFLLTGSAVSINQLNAYTNSPWPGEAGAVSTSPQNLNYLLWKTVYPMFLQVSNMQAAGVPSPTDFSNIISNLQINLSNVNTNLALSTNSIFGSFGR
ncbi:MAG: hypothetical protein A2096_14835 [Spirochaetes bacterium GWF1_41_5]|nr:MAG: hypothetical protein A2096_14835 [Spirochaetes bacterium GWF1_41_5]